MYAQVMDSSQGSPFFDFSIWVLGIDEPSDLSHPHLLQPVKVFQRFLWGNPHS